MNPKSHLFSLPLSSSKGEGKNCACGSSLLYKNTTLEFAASLWTNDQHMCSASKLLEKNVQVKQHKPLSWPGAAQSTQGLYMGSFYEALRGGNGQGCLQAPWSQAAFPACTGWPQGGRGPCAGKEPPGVLSQPWGRKGDFQLPALWALSSSLGACCWGSLGCRGGTEGWSRCQRLDLGLLLWGLQLLRSSLGSYG